MNPSYAILARKISVALCAIALASGAIIFSYQVGCAQNAAGNTSESLDFQLVSAWLMIPSLMMFAVLFAVAKNCSMLQTALRAACFLILAMPFALAVSLYTESHGETARWNPESTSCKRVTSSPVHSVGLMPNNSLKAGGFAAA
jgi:hypothetical protein